LATPEYRKMREVYPDLTDEQVMKLAEEAVKMRLQREATEVLVKKQSFEDELSQKLAETLAQLTIKYNYNIYNKEVCVQTPKIELPYRNVAELAENFQVIIREKAAGSAQFQTAAPRTTSAATSTPVEMQKRPSTTTAGSAGRSLGLRVIRWIVTFGGAFLFFYGIYSAFNTEHFSYLIYSAIGIGILFLLRVIPRG
jgi:hypothetical protein